MFKFTALVCALLVASASAALIRTPSHDSAIIKSERLGGNFAYSTVEGHAYASVDPIIAHVPTPVAVSYSAHAVPLAAPAIHIAP
ncbi:hypothetical protein, partial [Neisseria meningitidis]|uniref:hypothetical protein n=1 Tax=Neisseria meningitidis TaxID=487 RepID=UPI001C56B91D